ncbi:MAG: TetR family transcriptional regulator [Polyangiaceae bacterium]
MNAALSLVDKRGIDGFTVRALARVVDAPPMSLYTHFANKEELLDLMCAEISRRIYAEEHHPTWQAELLAMSKRVLRTLGDHTKWVELLSRSAPAMMFPTRERVLRLMVDDGLSHEAALQGLAAVLLTSVGLVITKLTMNGGRGKSALATRFAKVRAGLEKDPTVEEETTRLAMAKVGRFDFEAQLEFTIQTLIAGLEVSRR